MIAGLDRVRQQGKKLGRFKVSAKVDDAVRGHLRAGNGILKGGGDCRRRKWDEKEMTGELATAA
jgi:hypothetical protein